MTWQISLFITIVLILLGCFSKNSKLIWFFQIIWLWILMAGSDGGIDYSIHNLFFNLSNSNYKILSNAWLYKLICLPFYKANLKFYNMNFIASTVLIIIFCKIIKKNTENVAYVTSLFFIFPLADSIIQKRNFMANIIYLIGLLSLIKKENKSTLKYIFFTLVAAQIHSTYYSYLLIIPFFNMRYETLKKFMPYFMLISFAIIPIIPKLMSLILAHTSIFSKIRLYFETLKIPLYQSACWWILHLIYYFLFNKLQKVYKNEYSLKELYESENLIKINTIFLGFMPLYYYEPTFFRFFRNILLINYIFASKKIGKKNIMNKNKLYLNLAIFAFSVLVFLSQFVIFGKGFNTLVRPIFEENFILNKD